MADRRISELPVIPAVAGDDALAIVDTSLSETNKVSVEDLLRSAPAGTAAAPSIAFVDDPDTGFYRSAANELSISTNGGQRVVVDDAGNVGIGVSSPDSAFHVYKQTNDRTARFQRISTQYIDVQQDASVNKISGTGKPFYLGSADTQPLVLETNATERMRIDSAGSVGIGTSSPTASLEIATAVTSGVPSLYLNRLANQADTSDIALRGNSVIRSEDSLKSVVNDSGIFSWNIGGTDSKAGISGSSEVMRINSAGSVGIGTSSPDAPLHIEATVPELRFTDSDATNTPVSSIIANNGDLAYRPDNGATGTGGTHVFYGSSDSETARITPDAKVGIGTSSPARRLHVTNSSGIDGVLAETTGSTGSDQARFQIKTPNSDYIWYSTGNSNALALYDQNASAERMRIRSNGVINYANCPTYADDTAAGSGGLVAGDVYKTSTGELRIKL